MCGISGLICEEPLSDADLTEAKRMNAALFHRGPDGEGFFQSERLILGMRRLSIIDVAGANQPLFGSTQETVVLFNGEIYNYLELRAELETSGHCFTTHGDGEVVPHLYEKYGIDFVHRLRGMFAISLLDRKRERFYLLRDRMGEKPIYYRQAEGRFSYASEMKALLETMPVRDRRLSAEAINHYLHYQFVPEPMTLIREVRKVPAGHYLDLDLKSLRYETKKYWDFSAAPPVECADPIAEVRGKLDSITKIIGRSDVPVGIALSGGVDSSAVAALFEHENRDRELTRAFTVGYAGEPETDERKFARALAQKLRIPIVEIELRTEDFVESFPDLVGDMDDPVADIAAYGIYSVMKAARRDQVKVLLNGVGADEIFWGYSWVTEAVRESAKRTGDLVFYDSNRDYRFAARQVSSLYPKALREEFRERSPESQIEREGKQDVQIEIMNRLVKGWLFADPVALGDRLSMANSVELRSPFLDHELVELVVGLNKARPDLYRDPAKELLKKAVRGLVPDEVLNRPKQGFTPPATRWRLGVIRRYGSRLWNGYLVREKFIERSGLAKLLLVERPTVFYLYKLVLLELWCERFLEGSGKAAA
ncbi:MAG: asparagine synthase (glutamine-hydrolyzing) [Bdellovibrionales bacterium]|nr:asparagine synthase (glutamine-hydrolyzing) [Bdellovibrionales bacterium]